MAHLMVSSFLCSSGSDAWPLKGAMSIQKSIQWSKTETRELFGGREEKRIFPTRGHTFASRQIKKETEKNELVARPVENWRPRVGWVMGGIKSAPPETAHRGSWGRNTAIERSMSAWDFFTCSSKLAKSLSTFPQKSLDEEIMSSRILSNSSQVDEKKGSLKKGSRMFMGTMSREEDIFGGCLEIFSFTVCNVDSLVFDSLLSSPC